MSKQKQKEEHLSKGVQSKHSFFVLFFLFFFYFFFYFGEISQKIVRVDHGCCQERQKQQKNTKQQQQNNKQTKKNMAKPLNIRVVCLSDTHGTNNDIPEGDILLHGGDFTHFGKEKDFVSFGEWLEKQSHPLKVFFFFFVVVVVVVVFIIVIIMVIMIIVCFCLFVSL